MTGTAIFGVGAIGGYVGAHLAASGAPVLFHARPQRAAVLRETGLATTDGISLPGNEMTIGADPARLCTAERILLTIKATGLEAAGQILHRHVPPQVPVFCLLNGLSPLRELRARLPDHTVLGGMVPFNIVADEQGRLHRSSLGQIVLEADPQSDRLADLLDRTACPAQIAHSIAPVQVGKLLLNLNNPVNALSGLPIKAQLSQRDYRRVYALAFAEALSVLKAAGIHHVQTAALPAKRIARVLEWPNWLFNTLALPRQDIDASAMTSMAQDIAAGRRTEIDTINGEIVKIAGDAGRNAPVNATLVRLIRSAEAGGRKHWDGAALLDQVRKAR